MQSDDWLSLGFGHPFQWIDVLHSLLESPLGDRIVDRCIRFGYDGTVVSCLVSLRAPNTIIDAIYNTLRLVTTADCVHVAACPLQSIVP